MAYAIFGRINNGIVEGYILPNKQKKKYKFTARLGVGTNGREKR